MTNTIYEQKVREMPVGLNRAALQVLSFHIGRARTIGRADLVEALRGCGFDVQERLVRRAIHDLRRAGHLVCSAPGESGGYYLAATLDEFREFCDRELHPKAIDMLETESKMKEAARQQFGDASQAQLI
jgi:DNA-binding transcriptional regulator PaaX